MEENELITQLVPAVEQQICSPITPFVKKHFERMQSLGETEFEAKKMIALCLADETNRMYIDSRDFDIKRYESLLVALPDLPE
ncbi:hypothetical protein OAB00_00115 [Akkermansiaceae bacterium]|nr:hypothetical protein [Akkermansiaceae bacterium]